MRCWSLQRGWATRVCVWRQTTDEAEWRGGESLWCCARVGMVTGGWTSEVFLFFVECGVLLTGVGMDGCVFVEAVCVASCWVVWQVGGWGGW